jgi:hypothetical protein
MGRDEAIMMDVNSMIEEISQWGTLSFASGKALKQVFIS